MIAASGAVAPAIATILASTVPPIPAETTLHGPLWSLVVPAVVFIVSFVATYLLFRHFANEHQPPERGNRQS